MADSKIKVQALTRLVWDGQLRDEGDVFEVDASTDEAKRIAARYVSDGMIGAVKGARSTTPARNVQPPGSPAPVGTKSEPPPAVEPDK